MKTKRAILAISITALIVIIILISLRAYYVTIALIAGTLIIGHREFCASWLPIAISGLGHSISSHRCSASFTHVSARCCR